MIAMVELDLPEGREDEGEFDNHTSIFIFSATTVTLISLHLFALMVATSVLPYLKSAIEDIDYYLARKGVITWSNAQEPGHLTNPPRYKRSQLPMRDFSLYSFSSHYSICVFSNIHA